LKISRFIRWIFPLFVLLFAVPAAAPADETADFLWWRLTNIDRTSDGGMTAEFELLGQNSVSAEVLYKSMPRLGYGGARDYGQPEIYRKKLNKPDGASTSSASTVTIYSGRAERIELFASAANGGSGYYAGAIFNCYGESGLSDPDSERVYEAPDWPAFHPAAGKDGQIFYRAETGKPITLVPDFTPVSVKVFENTRLAAFLERDQSGGYSYTPPHDEKLSEAGYSAKHDVVFEAALPDGGAVSFYLPVYRAFYGRANLGGGVAVLASAALASLVFVLQAGRSFPWQ
jgi:hypothetical protein